MAVKSLHQFFYYHSSMKCQKISMGPFIHIIQCSRCHVCSIACPLSLTRKRGELFGVPIPSWRVKEVGFAPLFGVPMLQLGIWNAQPRSWLAFFPCRPGMIVSAKHLQRAIGYCGSGNVASGTCHSREKQRSTPCTPLDSSKKSIRSLLLWLPNLGESSHIWLIPYQLLRTQDHDGHSLSMPPQFGIGIVQFLFQNPGTVTHTFFPAKVNFDEIHQLNLLGKRRVWKQRVIRIFTAQMGLPWIQPRSGTQMQFPTKYCHQILGGFAVRHSQVCKLLPLIYDWFDGCTDVQRVRSFAMLVSNSNSIFGSLQLQHLTHEKTFCCHCQTYGTQNCE
jgi:hypothetical protein